MQIPLIDQIDVTNKAVILRAVLNVPIQNGAITDELRIDATIPTIKYLLDHNCKVIIVGHLGRPQGQRVPEMSVKIVAEAVAAKLNHVVNFIPDFTDPVQNNQILNGQPGDVFMLENIRYYPEEESKDPAIRSEFAQRLAALGEIYINDAFADYRPHASTYDIAKIMPVKAIGFHFASEVAALDKVMQSAEHPFVAVIGGAKLSEKIDILNTLGSKADKIIIGGAMAYNFLKSQGYKIGDSLFEPDKVDVAAEILQKYGDKIELPIDHIAATEFSENAVPTPITGKDIPDGLRGLDIGPDTVARYIEVIKTAKTILWNGPMGVFEWDKFSTGTRLVGGQIADQEAYTLVGGGDTISAVNSFNLTDGINHICTGGGAMLEYISRGTLDTLEAFK